MSQLINRFKAPRPAGIVLAVCAALLLVGLMAGHALAAVAMQEPLDVATSPIVVALMALLAIPAITSGVTGILRKVSDAGGVNPRVIVYTASILITGALVATGTVTLPDWTGDPGGYMLAWMAWLTANAELARRIYDLIQPIVWPDPPPAEPA